MKRISWNDPNAAEQLNALYNRPACPREVEQSVAEIVANVRENGDSAVCGYLARFDKVTLSPEQFTVQAEEYAEAELAVDETAKQSIAMAIAHVTAFAEQAKPHDHSFSRVRASRSANASFPWNASDSTSPAEPLRLSRP